MGFRKLYIHAPGSSSAPSSSPSSSSSSSSTSPSSLLDLQGQFGGIPVISTAQPPEWVVDYFQLPSPQPGVTAGDHLFAMRSVLRPMERDSIRTVTDNLPGARGVSGPLWVPRGAQAGGIHFADTSSWDVLARRACEGIASLMRLAAVVEGGGEMIPRDALRPLIQSSCVIALDNLLHIDERTRAAALGGGGSHPPSALEWQLLRDFLSIPREESGQQQNTPPVFPIDEIGERLKRMEVEEKKRKEQKASGEARPRSMSAGGGGRE